MIVLYRYKFTDVNNYQSDCYSETIPYILYSGECTVTTKANKEQTAVIDNTPDQAAALDTLIHKVKNAQRIYSGYTQKQVDDIFRAAAMAANSKRIELAKLAAQETRMGIAEDKVIKNHFADRKSVV